MKIRISKTLSVLIICLNLFSTNSYAIPNQAAGVGCAGLGTFFIYSGYQQFSETPNISLAEMTLGVGAVALAVFLVNLEKNSELC